MNTIITPKSLLNDGYEALMHATAAHLLGSQDIWEVETDSDTFDELYKGSFLKHNNGSRLVHKALRTYQSINHLSYNQMVDRMLLSLKQGLKEYQFSESEKLYLPKNESDGIQLNYGYELRKLVNAGIRPSTSVWSIEPALLDSFTSATFNNNFYSYVYGLFFEVPEQIKQHLDIALPNVAFPHHLKEAYYYLKFLRMPKLHDANICFQAIQTYNKSVDKSQYDFHIYLSDENYKETNKEAFSEVRSEGLLLMLLTYSSSCIVDELVWSSIDYTKIFQIFIDMLNYKRADGTSINGRIINQDFYKDMIRVAHILIKNSLYSETNVHNADLLKLENVMSGSEIIVPEQVEVKEISNEKMLEFLSSNIASDNWNDWGELPSSWLALL